MESAARRLAALLVFCLPSVLPFPAAAGDRPGLPAVRAAPVSGPIVVDGRLDEEAWLLAPAADGFRQLTPDEGAPATERTAVRFLYDEDALYVGVRLHDRDPGRIVRRLSRRDVLPDADYFALYLDPQHDHLTGVGFLVTAGGVQMDLSLYNDTWTDASWDAVWASAVSVDEHGWSVEMRIPFSQLRFRSAAQQVWGVNAQRLIHRRQESSWLVMIPSNETGFVSRMAHLAGLDGLRPRRHVEVLPYFSGRSEHIEPERPGDPFNSGARGFAGTGLDLKYRLTGTLTLDVAINPDFGQVEVDPAVVNLSAFETFFEEKRPFFIEGSQTFTNIGRGGAASMWGFFRTEPELFYSRRIGRQPQGRAEADFVDHPRSTTILGAAKLTGRTAGGWSVGMIEAVTGRQSARLDHAGVRSRHEVEPLTNYWVARAHREVRGRGGLGFLATAVHRDLREPALADRLVKQAYVLAGDGHFFFDSRREWVVTGSMAGSLLQGSAPALLRQQQVALRYYQRPDAPHVRLDETAGSMRGWTGHVDLNRNSGNVHVNAGVWGISPGFDSNDAGFMFQADRAGAHTLLGWSKPTVDRYTRNRTVWAAKWWTWNYGGDSQGDGVQAGASALFRNYWRLDGQAGVSWDTWDDRLTRGGPTTIRPGIRSVTLSFGTDARRTLSLEGTGTLTDRNYASWSRTARLSLALKPTPSLTLAAGPALMRQRLVSQYVGTFADPLADATFGARYVFGTIDQTQVAMVSRANLVLSPRLSLQVYAQPLLSVGDFTDYKELARPRTFDFIRYGVDAGSIERTPAGQFVVDPDAGGPAAPFTFAAPDFNLKSLRANAIFRWEWRPGSTLYLVWTQQREDLADPGDFAFGRDLRALADARADNVLLVKVSYWFTR